MQTEPQPQLRSSIDDQRVAYYQLKADECRSIALAASVAARGEWLRLADQWTYLALRFDRDGLTVAGRPRP